MVAGINELPDFCVCIASAEEPFVANEKAGACPLSWLAGVPLVAAVLAPGEGVKLKPAKVLGFACRDTKEVSLDNVGSRAALTGVAEVAEGVPKLPNAGAGVEGLDDAGAGDPVVDLRPGKPRIL